MIDLAKKRDRIKARIFDGTDAVVLLDYMKELEAKLELQTHNATKQKAIANEAMDKWSKVKAKLKLAEDGLNEIIDEAMGNGWLYGIWTTAEKVLGQLKEE